MLRKFDLWRLWKDDALCALLQRRFEQWDEIGWFGGELVGELFIVGDEMCNVDVTEVLLHKNILSNLVSVDESAIKLEGQDELLEFGLDFCSWFCLTILKRCEDAERIG